MRQSSVIAAVALAFTATLAVAAPPAQANDGALAEQAALAQQRADRAFNGLSDRYAEIWARLPAADKGRFSAQERAWLNEGRWQEQRVCVVAQAATPGALARANCQAEITERHLLQLESLVMARR